MSKTDQEQHRARYTLEFKLEAVRLAEKSALRDAGERPVSAEQMPVS